ncbi:MAG: hypothetical protein HUJ25_01300 [Crocinitomicaceae bacterium]|nr:hypothetical protein [Crocinitomicaceae bacterium]
MGSVAFEYPQYRKYTGIDTWFRIESEKKFTEIKRIGENYLSVTILAVQYPEKVLINDMLNCHENRWEIIDKNEWDRVDALV